VPPVANSAANVVLGEMRTPLMNFPDDVAAPAELPTKKELARRLRVSERKIELDTDLPRIRWGRTVRFDWGEVVDFLEAQRA